MIRGMETQLSEWETHMSPTVTSNRSIRLAILFTRVFLSGAPLLKLPSAKIAPALDGSAAFRADPARLIAVVPALHALYDFLLGLAPRDFNAFIGVEWGALILSIILGFRMSFPLLVCPEWDDRAARQVVRFEEYITRFCRLGDGGGGAAEVGAIPPPSAPVPGAAAGQAKSMDVLSASRIVLDMVKRKFMRRLVKLEGTRKREKQQQQQEKEQVEALLAAAAAAAPHPMPAPIAASSRAGREVPVHDSATSGCPMMDGSLEPYYPYWDETFNNGLAAAGAFVPVTQGGEQAAGAAVPPEPGSVELPDDLWTAMTMGWAQGDINFDAV
jgi:hypothetical protein